MKEFTELTIVTPNALGKLAEVLRALATAKVNLIAIDSSSGYDLNMVRLVTNNPPKARKVLERLGHNVTESTPCWASPFPTSGQLCQIAAVISKSRVNIDYIYATAVAYDQPGHGHHARGGTHCRTKKRYAPPRSFEKI